MVLLGVIVLAINVYLVHNIRSRATLQDVLISDHQGVSQQETSPGKQNPTLWIYHKTVSFLTCILHSPTKLTQQLFTLHDENLNLGTRPLNRGS